MKEVEAKKNSAQKDDTVLLYGKPAKVNPSELEVTASMIGHVTNAKSPLKHKKTRGNVNRMNNSE